MYIKDLKCKNSQLGFGILELAILLSLLSALAFVLMVMPDEYEQLNREQDRKYLRIADEQLINFVGLNGRLPCPASSANGLEDCNVSKGTLPYITLGLKEPGYSSGDIALRYGVFRNSQSDEATNQATEYSNDADLAVRKNRYEPLDANGDIQAVNNENTLDFCVGLINASSATFSINNTYIQENSSTQYAVAYAIASPGANGIFDGLNGLAGQGFNAASESINPATYDDHVLSRGHMELYSLMQCDISKASLNMMANAVLVQDQVKSQAESLADDVVMGTVLAGVGVALNTASAVIAGVDLANASATLATASGLLSGAIAGCAVAVGCPLVPVYTAAVAAATTGVVLSGVAVGASVAAVVAQAIATGLYADAAIRAQSAAGSVGTQDWSSAIESRQSDLATAQASLLDAQNIANSTRSDLDIFRDAYNTNRNNIRTYAADNDDPDFTGTPDVTNKTESMYAAIKTTFELRNTYYAAEAIYTDLQQQCDACPSPNVNTTVPADGVYPAYEIFACETSSSGSIKICDSAASQKAVSDTALANVTNSNNNIIETRNAAIQAALDFQIYTGRNSDNNKTFMLCSGFSECPLPRWVDNTWQSDNTFDMDKHYYSMYLLKQSEYENAVADVEAKQTLVDALTMSIAAMQCSQDGKVYRETALGSEIFECVDSSPSDVPDAVNFAQGAKDILDSADQRGVSE